MNVRSSHPNYRRPGEDPTGIRMMLKVLAGTLASAVLCAYALWWLL